MPSYLLVANPASGRGQGAKRARILRDHLASSGTVTLMETSSKGAATRIAEAHGGRVDRVVAVGGDGLLNEVLVGVLRCGGSAAERPALGFLPSGAGSAAVRAFGLSADPVEQAQGLRYWPERPVDVGMARTKDGLRPFLLWLGAGWDAVALDAFGRRGRGDRGAPSLLLGLPAALGALRRYPAPTIRTYTLGGERLEGSSVVLANVGRTGFGGAIADTADPFDGRMDLVAVSPESAWQVVRLAARTVTSSLHRAPGAVHARIAGVELESDGSVPVQLDGRPAGTLPVSVRTAAGAVRLIAPTERG